VGLLLKLSGKKVIYDVHEDVAKDIFDKKYIPRLIRPFVQAVVHSFEWLAAASFDRVVAATSSIARNFPARKVTLVRNVPIGEELLQPDPKPFRERPRNVVYIGGLAPFNGVEQMVKAMGMLPAEANVRLILAGKFVSAEQEAAIRQLPGWARVDYHGWIGREKIPALFGQARAALVVYQPTPNTMECEPNKFFEVLSAGLPLIASELPHWRRFIEEHQCGIALDPTSPAAIASAIHQMVDQPDQAEAMGQNGRIAVARDYNWVTDAARLVALYDSLLGPSR
jgi:glycosyltransferase involved in cell wall biosynthesis